MPARKSKPSKSEIRELLARGMRSSEISAQLRIDGRRVNAEELIVAAEKAGVFDASTPEMQVLSVLRLGECAISKLRYVPGLMEGPSMRLLNGLHASGRVRIERRGTRSIVSLAPATRASATDGEMSVEECTRRLADAIAREMRAKLQTSTS